MSKYTIFLGQSARKMKQTQKHRPAVWENMLGTVYAQNDDGDVRYFDYDYAAAFEFAGVSDDRDPRVARFSGLYRYHNGKLANTSPRRNQTVLWITK